MSAQCPVGLEGTQGTSKDSVEDKSIHSSNTSKNLANMRMTSLRYICISQGPVKRTEPMTGSRGYLLWSWVKEVLEEFTKGER